MNKNKSICVYCGSNFGKNPNYEMAAIELGEKMATNGIDLVYGGGKVGLMGALANSVLINGGKVKGVITK